MYRTFDDRLASSFHSDRALRLAVYCVCCCLFHSTHSSSFTPDPPKQSSALPMVRSTFPPLSFLTISRSARFRPPPAYVTGMLHH